MVRRVLFIVLVASLATRLAAQPLSVALTDVPDRLVLPLDAGARAIVTAAVDGTAERVWLAGARDGLEYTLRPDRTGAYRIDLGDPSVAALATSRGRDGVLRVFARAPDGRIASSVPIRYRFRKPVAARPDPRAPMRGALRGAMRGAIVKIRQRDAKRIEVAEGHVRVRCGDVTGGFVPVSVRIGGVATPSVPMREGEWMPVDLAGAAHRLTLVMLVNYLIGDDFAVFTLFPAPRTDAAAIDALEACLADAQLVFRRDGARVARDDVLDAFGAIRSAAPAETVDAFLARASAGALGVITCEAPGGDRTAVASWLRARLGVIEGRPTADAVDPDDPRALLRGATAACEALYGVAYAARAVPSDPAVPVVRADVQIAFGRWGDRSPSVRVRGFVEDDAGTQRFDAAFDGTTAARRGPGDARILERTVALDLGIRWHMAVAAMGPAGVLVDTPYTDPERLGDAAARAQLGVEGWATLDGVRCRIVRAVRDGVTERYAIGVRDLLPRRVESDGRVVTFVRVRPNRVTPPNAFRLPKARR